jgi:hypothetical protein
LDKLYGLLRWSFGKGVNYQKGNINKSIKEFNEKSESDQISSLLSEIDHFELNEIDEDIDFDDEIICFDSKNIEKEENLN